MLNTLQLYSTFHPRICCLVLVYVCFNKLPELPCLTYGAGQAEPLRGGHLGALISHMYNWVELFQKFII